MNARFDDPLSRRRFLSGLAATATAATTRGLLQAADDAANPYGGFTLGVQSYSFRHFDREGALKRIQELGLRYVELYQKHAPRDASPEQIRAILKMCGDYGITPLAWGVSRFTKDHDDNKRTFEFGKALGIRTFSANPTRDSFDSLDRLCEEYKISIGIHPHGPVGKGKQLDPWYSAEVIMDAVKHLHPLIGSCLDTGHLIRAAQLGKNLDPAEQVRIMGARNFGMHLKDHDNEKKTDVVFGRGALDVTAVLKALREVTFKGYISIEYEANEQNPSPDMKDCVAVFKESVKKLS